jgi:hypothetical protein
MILNAKPSNASIKLYDQIIKDIDNIANSKNKLDKII